MHIAFDIGNVFFELELGNFTEEFDAYFKGRYDSILFLKELQGPQDTGLTNIRRNLEILIHKIYPKESSSSINESIDKLCGAWCNILKPSEIMLEFSEELKNDGVKVALLSNVGQEHAEYLSNNYSNLFNNATLHLSYEVGARKPSDLYFKSFLSDHPDFKNCIYLDDLKENVDKGLKYKFDARVFNINDFKNAENKLKECIKKIKEDIKSPRNMAGCEFYI